MEKMKTSDNTNDMPANIWKTYLPNTATPVR